MQILIVAATKFEIAGFPAADYPTVDFLITGVGAPLAIYHLTKRLHLKKYDLVIQAGIAGSFKKSLAPGEVVLVKSDCFADLGILENNELFSTFDKGFADKDEFPFNKGWLRNTGLATRKNYFKKVKGITINTVTDEKDQIKRLRKKFGAAVETMEGAALHYVCLQENIAFIQVRSISNYVGERNKKKWKLEEAIRNLNNSVQQIILDAKPVKVVLPENNV